MLKFICWVFGVQYKGWYKYALLLVLVVLGASWVGEKYVDEFLKGKQLVAVNQLMAVVAEAEELPSLSVEQLEEKLAHIVWFEESRNHVMEEGDIFPTFDPAPSMYEKCIQIGGKMNKDCLSYGPYQAKIGTIQYYWAKLHDGKTVSDREARDIAESNEESRRFFIDCSVKIKGCAKNWTGFRNHETEGQIYVDLLREAQGIIPIE